MLQNSDIYLNINTEQKHETNYMLFTKKSLTLRA